MVVGEWWYCGLTVQHRHELHSGNFTCSMLNIRLPQSHTKKTLLSVGHVIRLPNKLHIAYSKPHTADRPET